MSNLALAHLQKQAEKEQAAAKALARAKVWDDPYVQAFRAYLDATVTLFNLECEDRDARRDVDATKWAEPLAIAGKSIRENAWTDLFEKRCEQGGLDELLYRLLIDASILDIDALRTYLKSFNQTFGNTLNQPTWQFISSEEPVNLKGLIPLVRPFPFANSFSDLELRRSGL